MAIDPDTFVIETDRLVLKPISQANADDIFREFTEEITVFMTPVPPKHISETEDFIRDSRSNMERGEELVLVILERRSQEFLGIVGLHRINTAQPELGIWLKKSAHGNKYGREAVTAMKEWAEAHLSYEYLLYPVDKDNIASKKIPESLGGKLHEEYTKNVPSGRTLNTQEYRIYPTP